MEADTHFAFSASGASKSRKWSVIGGVEIIVRGQRAGQGLGLLHNDEIWESQSAKTVIRCGQTLELKPDRGWCEHAPEQIRQKTILTQPCEVEHD